jgi:hypothetical protein
MPSFPAILIAICLLMFIPTAQAWNKPGHMASAAIAYMDLKDRHPEVLAQALDVLKQHPNFDSMWAGRLSKVDDRDMYLFMLAASWPDDIKKQTHEYNA